MLSHRALALLSAFAVTVSLAAASSTDAAKVRKHKKAMHAPSAQVSSGGGTTVYLNGLYMGTDPDTNVRAWFYKDLSGRWGGSY